MSDLVAGIDLGTQSLRVLVYDPERRAALALTSAPLDLISGADGSREQLAAWWLQALHVCFDAIPRAVRARIAALAVSGQQHGFVPVAADGRVLAPVKLWCDTSTERECGEIMRAVGGREACIALTGNPVLPGYTASKLRWTRQHHPDAYRAMSTVLLPHDYLNFHLTGERWCEQGDASGTGWMDVRTRRWSPALLAAIDADRDLAPCLPPLLPAHALVPLRPAIADALGLPRSACVGAGSGDNMMAALGTGCVEPGRATLSLGTSGTLFAHAAQPAVDDEGRWAAFCAFEGGWLPLVCTMNCTVATETVATLCGHDARAGDALLAGTVPGAGGLTLLPFFNGERTPDLPAARGGVFGLEPGNATPAHLHRAAMEGATFALRYGADALHGAAPRAHGVQGQRITLTGGGARSAAWRQMVADVFEAQVEVPRQTEGAAFGAALAALWALEHAQRPQTALAEVVGAHLEFDDALTAVPAPESVEMYRAPYARFLRLLDTYRALYAAPQAGAADSTFGAAA